MTRELRVQLLKHVADEFIRIDGHDIHILNSAQFMVFLTSLVYSYIANIAFSDNLYTAKSERTFGLYDKVVKTNFLTNSCIAVEYCIGVLHLFPIMCK